MIVIRITKNLHKEMHNYKIIINVKPKQRHLDIVPITQKHISLCSSETLSRQIDSSTIGGTKMGDNFIGATVERPSRPT